MDISISDVIHRAVGEYKRSGNVDLVKLIDDLGIPVYVKDVPDSDSVAKLIFNEDEDVYEIEINNNARFDSKLIRTKVAVEFAKLVNEVEEESTEEDLFNLASSILLPDEIINDFINSKNIKKEELGVFNDSLIDDLCSTFEVPHTVAAARLQKLGYLSNKVIDCG